MKLKVAAVAMAVSLAFAGTTFANNWKGGGGYYHSGQMPPAVMNQQVDQATLDKISKFWSDNQAAQKEITMKNAERMALLNNTNPDPATVAKITGELFDLRNALREKAEGAGITSYMGRYAMGSGAMGPHGNGGRGRGSHGARW